MPMSAGVLGPDILTKLQAKIRAKNPELATQLDSNGGDLDWLLESIAEACAEAIVAHIVATAVITVPNVSGVTVGAGVSGPGTGSIA